MKQSQQHSRPIETLEQAMLLTIGRLTQSGYQALLAGGCVRDKLLGIKPHDYDIATNATPETVMRLFKRTIKVGAQFGVVVVLIDQFQIEVATFRTDAFYSDGRRPDHVVFTDAQHDAQRRDFTINGMFYDPLTETVIDYVGGREDLRQRVIRAIRDPEERFAEDHLRMLRAIRFACRLHFDIEPDTWQAMVRHAQQIQLISPERVADELIRMLDHASRKQAMTMAYQAGLLPLIFKPLEDGQLRRGLAMLEHLPDHVEVPLALACLLVEASPQQVEQLCRDLRSSNDLRKETAFLVLNRAVLLDALPLTRGRLKQWLAEPYFRNLRIFVETSLRLDGESLSPLQQLDEQIEDLGDDAITPPPLLSGDAIMEMGVAPGPRLGRLVNDLYLAQLENEVTTQEQARQWVQRWLDDDAHT